jgi:uncharacterized protein (PEP-CTERM system associated)
MLGLSISHSSMADVNINTGVEAEFVKQTVDDIDNDNEIDSDNIIIRPFLSFGYDSRNVNLLFNVTLNHIHRSLEEESVTNNYTDWSYLGNYQLIDNLLYFQANGGQNYRARSANSFLVDDFLLNAENLNKNTFHSASLNLNIPTGNYIGLSARAGANTISTEAEDNSGEDLIPDFQDFSSQNYNGSIQIEGGRDLRPFIYNADASIQISDRERQQDFKSQLVNLMVGSNIGSQFSLRLLGYYENNEINRSVIGDDNGVPSFANALREFYSYGVGFAWQPSQNRFIQLGLNRSITKGINGEEDEEDSFISADFLWNFSSRTSVSGNYSRRFFGDAATFSFSHNLKNWRSSITYNEAVTTNSHLILSEEEAFFACGVGASSIADCSLPTSLDPDSLGPNEVLVPFITPGFEVNDRVVIRKVWSAQTSVDLRRTTLTASVNKSSSEEVELFRENEIYTGRLRAALRLSERSTISTYVSYSDINRITLIDDVTSIVKEAGVEFERKLSRRFFATFGYRYLDRGGDNIGSVIGGIQGITGPLTDNRISASIRYEFDNKL